MASEDVETVFDGLLSGFGCWNVVFQVEAFVQKIRIKMLNLELFDFSLGHDKGLPFT